MHFCSSWRANTGARILSWCLRITQLAATRAPEESADHPIGLYEIPAVSFLLRSEKARFDLSKSRPQRETRLNVLSEEAILGTEPANWFCEHYEQFIHQWCNEFALPVSRVAVLREAVRAHADDVELRDMLLL